MQVSSVNFWSMHNAATALALSLYPCKGVHDSFLFKLHHLQLEDTQIARSSTRSQAPHSHCTPAIWLYPVWISFVTKKFVVFLCSGPRTVFCSNWWTRSWPALVFRPLKIYLDDDVFQRRMLESYAHCLFHSWCLLSTHYAEIKSILTAIFKTMHPYEKTFWKVHETLQWQTD